VELWLTPRALIGRSPLSLGNEVEYTVAQRKGQSSAKDVRVLPAGTIKPVCIQKK
jgi:hypothetical protein